MIVTLYDADDQPHVLACPSDGLFELGRRFGFLNMAPVVHNRQVFAGADGAETVSTTRQINRLAIPMRLTEGNIDDLLARVDQLRRALRPGDTVRLRVERPGVDRSVTLRFESGAEFDPDHIFSPTTAPRLIFAADRPWWWRTTNPTSTLAETFNNAFTAGMNEPVILTSSDVEVHPTIRVYGPVENVNIMNRATGKTIRVIAELPNSTDLLEIRTGSDGRAEGILNGQNNLELFDANTDLSFGLVPGRPNRLLVSGLTTAALAPIGRFEIEWTDHYEGP